MVQGVKVERATVRTTLTPWAATARLCLVEGGRDGSPTTLAPFRPALANGAPPIPESERPRRRHPLEAADGFLASARSTSAPGAASRGGDRRQAAPLRRRAPAPCAGLDEVEKVLSRFDELLAVVAPHVGAVAVQGVQETDRVDLGPALWISLMHVTYSMYVSSFRSSHRVAISRRNLARSATAVAQ